MTTQSVAALVLLAALPLAALGLGADHPPGKIDARSHPEWPAGTVDLVNSRERVHGCWVNQGDFFDYAGDAKAFNAFVAAYSKLPDTPHEVVVHAGRAPKTRPLAGPHTLRYDWRLDVVRRGWGAPTDPAKPDDKPGYVVTVHVYVGEALPLDKLDIPKNVAVTSAGDVEEFIRKRAPAAGK